jgi:tripartite-type tricarboxylate transporter receptor subunit TctC
MWRFMLALILTLAAAGPGQAQSNWPDRPLRLIVPLPAGSAVDVIARLMGQRLSARLGQPVVIENRAGASGTLGVDLVAKSAPDGFTIGMATSTQLMTAPALNAKLPYDAVRDFVPVALVGVSPYVLVIHPQVAARNVAELITLARAKPKTLSYSSVGSASQAHLAGELFAAITGTELNHIPYKTSTHAVIDLSEGRIDMQFGLVGSSLTHIREGKLRALAVTTEQRIEELPDVPTMIESGLPGYEVSLQFTVVLPAAAPQPIVTRLNREIGEIMATPEVKSVLARQAIHVASSTPERLRERIAKEIELWRGLAQKAGIKPETGG